MSKKVCIFPLDSSTDFLYPLYESLCTLGWVGWHGDTLAKTPEALSLLYDAGNVAFLGHGSSGVLYGSPMNGVLTDFISSDNVDKCLRRKRLFLLSCNSSQFCEAYSLDNAIGFGNMPTGIRDVKSQLELNPDFPKLTQKDICIYNAGLVRSLQRSFINADFENLDDLYSKIQLFSNIEIVECLINRPTDNFREVASLFQDFKNECMIY